MNPLKIWSHYNQLSYKNQKEHQQSLIIHIKRAVFRATVVEKK